MEWIRYFAAAKRFERNWSPVRFDQPEWGWWRGCELTDAMGMFLKVRKPVKEIVEAIWMVCESAVSDGVHGEE